MDKNELLEYWKQRLCLQDWRIELCDQMKPEDMTIANCCGCAEWTEAMKTARVEILDPIYYGERIVPFNYEKTLVHELLHLKFSFWCQNEDNLEDRAMHQIIDDLARALTQEVTHGLCNSNS